MNEISKQGGSSGSERPWPILWIAGTLVMVVTTVLLLTTPHPILAVVPAGALLALLMLEQSPTIGYYLIVALIPFGAYRSATGTGGYLRIHWVLGVVLVGLAFLHWIPRKGVRRDLYSTMWPLFGLFIILRILASLPSSYPTTAWTHVILLMAACVFVGVTMLFVSKRGFLYILPAVVVFSVTFSSFLSVVGYFFEIPYFAEKAVTGAFKRGTGAAPDPNNLALMIVFAVPFAVHYMLHGRGLIRRGLAGGLILINVLAIITTYSRGGALMFGVMLLGLLIEYRHRLRPVHLGLVICGLALMGVFTVATAPTSYWDRLRSLTTAEDSAMQRRLSYVKVAARAFAERPILGHGPGAFRKIYAQTEYAERFQSRDETKERAAHNTYLDILVGSGILGLLVFLGILYVALRNFWVAKKRAGPQGGRKLSVLMGTYRLSFILVLLYLLIFSDPYHKYMLLSLGLSHVAVAKVINSEQED
ncbi:MAG: O-antigen ligase family protein [Planctomycetota bacterium]